MPIYDIELKKKIVQEIDKGATYLEITKKYNISRYAAQSWYKKYNQGESLANIKKKAKVKPSIDVKLLEEHMMLNPHSKLPSLAKMFATRASNISRLLKELGFIYKRCPPPRWVQLKKKKS